MSETSKFWHFSKFLNRYETSLNFHNSIYLYAENTFKLILNVFKDYLSETKNIQNFQNFDVINDVMRAKIEFRARARRLQLISY